MLISENWLRRYIALEASPEQIADALTMAGFPVVAVENVAGGDRRYDVEITSNRPDLQCHLGIARELAGMFDVVLTEPDPDVVVDDTETGALSVRVDAPDLCPLYTARVIRGVTVGSSPDWLVAALEAAGQRAVNNVVDVTNFVLLELGHPLHAFDLAKVRGATLAARRAGGEAFEALDGTKLTIGDEELAITDGEGPVALAGVMGGLDSEVGDETVDLALECALFHPIAIRRASRAHQLRTESSFRFERFVDPAGARRAADRAAELFVEVCGATSVGPLLSAGPGQPVHAAQITLRHAQLRRILGIEVEAGEARTILNSLGCRSVGEREWEAPSWRPDLVDEIDLIEEIARRIGFERIPSEVAVPVRPLPDEGALRARRRLRDAFVRAGLRECCTEPFVGIGHEDVALFCDAPALRVANPMRHDESLLRRSLLGPLLRVVKGNHDRGVASVRFFECAPVYLRAEDPAATDEVHLAAGAISGAYSEGRSAVMAVLAALNLAERIEWRAGAPAPLSSSRSATMLLDGETVGFAGELGRRGCRDFGLPGDTTVFELRADRLLELAEFERPYDPISRFPAVERDLALVFDESVPWGAVERAVRSAAGGLLSTIEPFDLYRSEKLGVGKKSVALRMHLRSAERTLAGDEVDACVAAVVTALEGDLGGQLRS